MKKNGFLTFIAAILPGCGQMYYGYMRRGLSLALWFWGIVFVASLSGLGVLAILLPVVWAYGFFDTFNIRALTYEQRLAFPDSFIPNEDWMRQSKVGGLFRKGGGRIAGWVLVVIGIIIVYNTLFNRIFWYAFDFSPELSTFMNNLPALVIAILIIVLGVRVLRGPAAGGNAPGDDEDDTVPFGGNGAPPQPPQGPVA